MFKYPSIETVFTRNKETNRLNFGEIREPEVECIREWTVSEKIDGTNIRVIVTAQGVEVRGRTDAATVNPKLTAKLLGVFNHEHILEYFRNGRPDGQLKDDWVVTFYGEGYGPGIQKAGGRYTNEPSFRCFDLKYGLEHWADDDVMRQVCDDLAINTVPWLGYTAWIPDNRAGLVALLPESRVARGERDEFYEGEGIVAKPRKVLLNYKGERLVWKLTHREFEKDNR